MGKIVAWPYRGQLLRAIPKRGQLTNSVETGTLTEVTIYKILRWSIAGKEVGTIIDYPIG